MEPEEKKIVMKAEDEKEKTTLSRREMLQTMGVAAATVAAGGLISAEAGGGQQAACPEDRNPYGSPPGSGISMPPYYLPTPSVKNRNNYAGPRLVRVFPPVRADRRAFQPHVDIAGFRMGEVNK